jgi:1-deoxy-D-xylulose-5-phosphate reductoisomerase
MKKVFILGSTGSIGENTLEVISFFKDKFKITGVVAGKNIKKLSEQIRKFDIKIAGIKEKEDLKVLKKEFPKVKFYAGEEEIVEMVKNTPSDIVVGAIVGSKGLAPSFAAIESGKTLALANKESLVMAGEIFIKKAKEKKKEIIPIDSEHSAIHQALRAGKKSEVKRLILTCSGGPFFKLEKEKFKYIKLEDALKHPTWNMGKKITIDSATLANKGLEVIEAHFLFGFDESKIDVVIHPQSIIHSMVEYVDGFIISQMCPNDMKFPIQYALSYPKRIKSPFKSLNLYDLNLSFFSVEKEKFPMLDLAYKSLKEKNGYPIVYSLSNELSVYSFIEGKISFTEIPEIVEESLENFGGFKINSIDEILEKEKELTIKIRKIIKKRSK